MRCLSMVTSGFLVSLQRGVVVGHPMSPTTDNTRLDSPSKRAGLQMLPMLCHATSKAPQSGDLKSCLSRKSLLASAFILSPIGDSF